MGDHHDQVINVHSAGVIHIRCAEFRTRRRARAPRGDHRHQVIDVDRVITGSISGAQRGIDHDIHLRLIDSNIPCCTTPVAGSERMSARLSISSTQCGPSVCVGGTVQGFAIARRDKPMPAKATAPVAPILSICRRSNLKECFAVIEGSFPSSETTLRLIAMRSGRSGSQPRARQSRPWLQPGCRVIRPVSRGDCARAVNFGKGEFALLCATKPCCRGGGKNDDSRARRR